jgi:hypothetical protein
MEKSTEVELISLDNRKSTGVIHLKYWEKKERTQRALTIWCGCWVAATFCVVLPLLHFFLVPSLLLAGPIAAFFVFQQTDVVLGGEGTCPRCGKPFKIARTKIKWPVDDVCSECHNSVKIYLLGEIP